jgi:truncated hemoglobin YjbI
MTDEESQRIHAAIDGAGTAIIEEVLRILAEAIRAARADERERLMGELQRIADHPGDFEVCEGCIDGILKYLRGEWKP